MELACGFAAQLLERQQFRTDMAVTDIATPSRMERVFGLRSAVFMTSCSSLRLARLSSCLSCGWTQRCMAVQTCLPLARWHEPKRFAKMSTLFLTAKTYTRLPVKAEGFEYTSTGTLPRPTLTVSNLDSTMTVLLLALVNATTAGNDLGGAEVRRIRTLKKYLDDINFRFENVAITQNGDTLITQSGDTF